MLSLTHNAKIYVHVPPTDLRKSFEGLSDLITHQFKADPLSGNLFVFVNRKKNRIKLLYFDGTGVWVCAKRLMGAGCFAWPATAAPGALQIVAEELTLLLTGIDLAQTQRRSWWRPSRGSAN